MNYNEFLLERKMNAAQVFLVENTLNITEIANKLEFVDSAYFAKVFKNKFGKSPTQYRVELGQ